MNESDFERDEGGIGRGSIKRPTRPASSIMTVEQDTTDNFVNHIVQAYHYKKQDASLWH